MTTPPYPGAVMGSGQQLHEIGAAYWGMCARRQLAKLAPRWNPSTEAAAIALVQVAASHGLKALGITFDRPRYTPEPPA